MQVSLCSSVFSAFLCRHVVCFQFFTFRFSPFNFHLSPFNLYLPQDAVHDPVDAGGADAIHCADAALLQVFHDVLNERKLYVLGVLDVEFYTALLCLQYDGFVGEDREAQLSLVAAQLDTVGACALVADKAPGAAAGQAVGKLEGCADGVLRLIESTSVAAETFCPDNGSEDFLQEVNLVGSKVVEVATTSYITLHAPGKGGAVVVEQSRRTGKAYLHGGYLADGSVLHQFLHFQEVGQPAPVVGHEAGNVCLFADAVDALAVDVAACQGLLHIDRLAGLHGHDGVGGMRGGWGGDVDGVDVGVADELLGVGVPARDVVPLGIGTCFLLAAAHHGLYL